MPETLTMDPDIAGEFFSPDSSDEAIWTLVDEPSRSELSDIASFDEAIETKYETCLHSEPARHEYTRETMYNISDALRYMNENDVFPPDDYHEDFFAMMEDGLSLIALNKNLFKSEGNAIDDTASLQEAAKIDVIAQAATATEQDMEYIDVTPLREFAVGTAMIAKALEDLSTRVDGPGQSNHLMQLSNSLRMSAEVHVRLVDPAQEVIDRKKEELADASAKQDMDDTVESILDSVDSRYQHKSNLDRGREIPEKDAIEMYDGGRLSEQFD